MAPPLVQPSVASPSPFIPSKCWINSTSIQKFSKPSSCSHFIARDLKENASPRVNSRRELICSLIGSAVSLTLGPAGANAARRPPPPPPTEKKDPNVSGVQAKILASKRRKEAMKEAMAKQREKGKPVSE